MVIMFLLIDEDHIYNDGRPVDAVRNLDGKGDNWRKYPSISMEICDTNVLYMWKPFNLLLDGKKSPGRVEECWADICIAILMHGTNKHHGP